MKLDDVARRGIVLLGCGKMGSAMLQGWLSDGLPVTSVHVLDPNPSDWVRALAKQGLHLNSGLPAAPAIALIAVKPQMMGDALPGLQALGGGATLFISVAAGIRISGFEAVLGATSPIVRAMPNTPAAVGKGITALIANKAATADHLDLADQLLGAIGQTVRLSDEGQMDGVTAVSGSGPAYVFHLIETLAQAGVAEGLDPDLAMTLAKATVAGAGALAQEADESPAQLRINVTSPGGTTAAALNVLMDDTTGFPDLLGRAVHAAAKRSKELSS